MLSNEDVTDVLISLDVGVLLSQIEGTPNVVMEYMLYGLPVICSNHQGCVNLLEDSTLLVNNNEDEILDAMEKIITSKSFYQKESENNLRHIKKYNVKSYVEDLEIILSRNFK